MNAPRSLSRLLFPVILAVTALVLGFSLVRASVPQAPAESIIYVDAGATGANDGTSWADAYSDLQDALSTAISGTQIWVAEGIYKPTTVITDRTASFNLREGVSLYGGFPAGGSAFEERDWQAHPTVLSGDIDNNDLAVPAENTDQIVGGNSYHVAKGEYLNAPTSIDGFIISGGQADGSIYYVYGGGMYIGHSNLTLVNITFRGNLATYGGGMWNYYSNSTLTNVMFRDNLAYYGGGMYSSNSNPMLIDVQFNMNAATESGGGMMNYESNHPTLRDVSFSNNSATTGGGIDINHGGGMYNYASHPILNDVTFEYNVSYQGGGMYNLDSNPILSGVLFIGNAARGISPNEDGGGMYNGGNSGPTLTHVTFANNSASYGGGMFSRDDASPTLTNVTFFGNTARGGGGIQNASNGNFLLLNAILYNNSADSGGGMTIGGNGLTYLTNVALYNNSATDYGGGISNSSNNLTLSNVTLVNNSAVNYAGGMYNYHVGVLQVNNSIFWNNIADNGTLADQQIHNNVSQPYIHGTDIQGSGGSGANWDISLGLDGGGNLDADPHFMRDPNPGPDTIWGTADDDFGDLRLQADSPAIDAGDNNALPADTQDLDKDGDTTEPLPLDISGNSRFVDIVTVPDTGITSTLVPDRVVDMGAYETQPFLSLAQTVIPQRAGPAQHVTYLITVYNVGPETATNVILTDTLPISVTVTGITSTLLITQTSGFPDYAWQVADLPMGTQGVITLTGVVTTALHGGETLWSTAAITASQDDPAPQDNRSSTPLYITEIIYVDAAATGNKDGTSWANAYTDLQLALGRAHPGVQIWVAEGIYKPAADTADRSATFQLADGVEMYGGFPGDGSIFARRDPRAYPTVLSGDIDNNDIVDSRGIITRAGQIRGNNSYHVLTAAGLRDITLLDGFFVTGGQANDVGYTNGGGLYNASESQLQLKNVAFMGNYAFYGGGMSNANSQPALDDVTFCGNTAQVHGGGLYTDNSSFSLTNARFCGNQSSMGGGIYNSQGNLILSNVLFVGNQAGDKGGGMLNDGGSPVMVNTTFANNHADYLGGGMYNRNSSTPQIANNILWGNTYGQGMNAFSQIANASGTVPELRHTLIQDSYINGIWDSALGLDAGGNIDADPTFVSAPDPGPDGTWGSPDDDYGDLHLQAQSAAIDAGDNSAVLSIERDLDGAPRFTDVTTTPDTGVGVPPIVDMGAYEAQLRLRVRVTQEDGSPAPDAVIYHHRAGDTGDALPIGGQKNPLRTNLQGVIQAPGGFQDGDGLMAAWPITVTEHYTVYLTSAIPLTDGLQWQTITDTETVQSLVVRRAYPLTVFHLEVSLEWDARNDPLFMEQLRYDLQRTADLLYDWTNGQATIGKITIYHNREHWNEADIRIYATNRLRPNATVGGVVSMPVTDPYTTTITYRPGQVNMGATWNRFGDPSGNLGEDWPRALAHELGHYLFFQEDNYLGIDPQLGLIVPIDGCRGVMTNPYRNDDENGYDEFHPLAAWETECANTLSNLETGRHDWGTITTFYPWLHEEPLNPGPNRLPLAVTRIEEILPPEDPGTLEVPIFYLSQNGEIVIPGNTARAFLFQPEQNALVDLGRPLMDQVLARGARPGDRLCVFELDASRLGCVDVSETNSELELHNLSQWQPDVIVSPVTSRTIAIAVSDVPTTDITLQGKLYPLDGNPSDVITLTKTADGYSGTFNLVSPALEGHIHLWVSGDSEPRREMLVDFGLGGSPGLRRPKDGRASPVVSPNGQIIIYGPGLNFPKGEFYVIQAATVIPNPPLWTYIVGSAYYLSASANAPALDDGVSIVFNYLGDDISPVDEQWLKVYFWDGASWNPLTTTLNTRYNLAAAPTQGEGLYALMASIESQLVGPTWNPIVYPVQETRPVTEALASVEGDFTQVCRYVPGDESNPWYCFNAGEVPTWVNDLLEMEYGAYWLFAMQDTTLYLKPDPLNPSTNHPAAEHPFSTPPLPPAIFYGDVLPKNDFVPAPGMQVKAWVNGHLCGQGETFVADGEIVYVVKVLADDGNAAAGCGVSGRQVTFTVSRQSADVWAGQSTWENIQAQELHLSPGVRVYLPVVVR